MGDRPAGPDQAVPGSSRGPGIGVGPTSWDVPGLLAAEPVAGGAYPARAVFVPLLPDLGLSPLRPARGLPAARFFRLRPSSWRVARLAAATGTPIGRRTSHGSRRRPSHRFVVAKETPKAPPGPPSWASPDPPPPEHPRPRALRACVRARVFARGPLDPQGALEPPETAPAPQARQLPHRRTNTVAQNTSGRSPSERTHSRAASSGTLGRRAASTGDGSSTSDRR